MRLSAWGAVSVGLLACGAASGALEPAGTGVPARAATPRSPSFVQNAGQFPEHVAFVAAGTDRTLSFDSRGLSLLQTAGARRVAVRYEFDGGARVRPRGEAALRGVHHHFHGHAEPVHARTFSSVVYESPWPGIDLRFDARPSAVEYTLVVTPGAEARTARFRVENAERVERTERGALAVTSAAGVVEHSRPVAWQTDEGRRVPVDVAFDVAPRAADGSFTYSFALGAHDPSRAVVIDPSVDVRILPTTLSTDDELEGSAVDGGGNVYVAGSTRYAGAVPSGAGADDTLGGLADGYVAKFTGDGDLLWASFIGGSASEYLHGLAVDAEGRAIVAGVTASADFPFDSGPSPIQSGLFLAKFDPDGSSLAYSGFVEGSSYGPVAVASGPDGSAYVGGGANQGLPETTVLSPTVSGPQHAFVMKFTAGGRRVYSLRLGAIVEPYGQTVAAISVDASGAAYCAGSTSGAQSLAPAGVAGSAYGGGIYDGFVVKVNPAGTALEYATFLGGSGSDGCGAIDVDGTGAAIVCGQTESPVSTFPRRTGPETNTTDLSPGVAFAARLSPSGQNVDWSVALPGGYQPNYTFLDLGLKLFGGDVYVRHGIAGLARLPADGSDAFHFPTVVASGTPGVVTAREVFLHDTESIVRLTDTSRTVEVPRDVAAAATSSTSVAVTWTSSADGVTSFDVERAAATGGFVVAGTVPADAREFTDTGRAPDTTFRYRVRARADEDASRASAVAIARTPGTFSLRVARGLVADSVKPKKDKVQLDGLALLESAASFDPAVEPFRLSIGAGASEFVVATNAGDSRWKRTPRALTFASATAQGRISLKFDLRRSTFRLRVSKAELAGLPADPAEVSMRAGDEADTDSPAWVRAGDVLVLGVR